MSSLFVFLAIWFLISIPVSLFLGTVLGVATKTQSVQPCAVVASEPVIIENS